MKEGDMCVCECECECEKEQSERVCVYVRSLYSVVVCRRACNASELE